MYLGGRLVSHLKNDVSLSGHHVSSFKRYYSTNSRTVSPIFANSWFVTGFTDAEGCFSISISKNNKYQTGWAVALCFQLNLHKKDLALLELFAYTLGVGKISKDRSACRFRVQSHKDIKVIIDHFEKFPLITQNEVTINFSNGL